MPGTEASCDDEDIKKWISDSMAGRLKFADRMTALPKSPPEREPVAETFEKELAEIMEREKDLKGEQRTFFSSIVERVRNNVDVLHVLREEHNILRTKLNKLVDERREKTAEPNLQSAIKHRTHEVNLLKKQIDLLCHKRDDALKQQKELEMILANFQHAADYQHPEEDEIKELKNKLDKANIKNSETKHLMKIYTAIIDLFDKQHMLWNPLVEKQQHELDRKHRDISELYLIARDSKFSKATAKQEFVRTERECNEQQRERDRLLRTKKKQLMETGSAQAAEPDGVTRSSRTGGMISSQPSQFRGRANKLARERKEERYRQVLAQYDHLRDEFGTTNPKDIEQIVIERRTTAASLHQQIEDLRTNRDQLNSQIAKLKIAIEEQEFTTAKGAGIRRMTAEGSKILMDTKAQLKVSERQLNAFHSHQKQVLSGIAHLLDLVGLVTKSEEEIPKNFPAILDWISQKVTVCQEALEDEDAAFVPLVNPQVYATFQARALPQEEEVRKPVKKADGFKRGTKDQKGEVQTRVLDRNAVKAAANRAVQLTHQHKRGAHK
jgi:hypothetical protein